MQCTVTGQGTAVAVPETQSEAARSESTSLPVSVIIPTYNRAEMTVRAIKSVLSDCRTGDEIIVIDDGSTDHTQSLLLQFAGRIRYFRMDHSGAGRARNFGVSLARNPLIAFLDSDDEWIPGNLELKRNLMRSRPDLVFCWSDFASPDEQGHLVHHSLAHWHKDPRSWDEILGSSLRLSDLTTVPDGSDDCPVHIGTLYHNQMRASYVAALTIVVRKQLAGEALYFAEDVPTYEDWLCFSLLSRVGPCAYLECETGLQHRHSGRRLTDADTLACATTSIAILERVWGKDYNFLQQHGTEYAAALRKQRLRRARALLSCARTREAREELNRLEKAPYSLVLLTYCARRVLKAAMAIRRRLRAQFTRA